MTDINQAVHSALTLKGFASELTANDRFLKCGIGGMAGAGKSTTATEFVIGAYKAFGYTKPVLVVDNEKGSRFLIPKFKRAGIPVFVKDTTNLVDVQMSIELLANREIDLLLIDSLTKVYYRYTRDYLAKAGGKDRDGNPRPKQFMELNDWGKLLPKWQEEFSDRFVSAQGSIVFTGRGGFSYDKEEDEKDDQGRVTKKGSFVKSGVKMKLAGETPFEPDLNIWMEQQQEMVDGSPTVWREAHVMKDRSGEIDGKTFRNPSYKDFAPFVDFLIAVPVGTVAGETSTQNIAPGENGDNYDRRRKVAIALEEIEQELVRVYPTTSAEHKRSKMDLLEKLFGTRSWTKIENLSLETLERGRNLLWQAQRGHAYGERQKGEAASVSGAGAPPSAGTAPTSAQTEAQFDSDDKIPHEAPAAAGTAPTSAQTAANASPDPKAAAVPPATPQEAAA